ncbi:MAG: Na+/H+ antiporter NhaA [Pseudomonadota bacterium]
MGVGWIKDFFQQEAAPAIILFVMAVAALILCNSPWDVVYQQFLQLPLAVHVAHYVIAQPLLFWVNEGLMTLFFLSVGLELKHELMQEGGHYARLLLPCFAALGGMVIPVLIYLLLNFTSSERLPGWAIPVATDIAFALGVLALFGKRVPPGLRMFLLTLAIFDDVGAIIIIAFFHPASLSLWSFGLALAAIIVLALMNYYKVRKLSLYMLVGLVLWLCVLKSGIHATVAGVVLGLIVPAGPAVRLQNSLKAWVNFFIMPLFAFANAGVDLRGLSLDVMFDSVTLGIILGLWLGKPVGVAGLSWLLLKAGRLSLPLNTTWLELFGTAALCGIGFTMSLFLGTLAFQNSTPVYLAEVKLGVLAGSLLSGITGALILRKAFAKSAK